MDEHDLPRQASIALMTDLKRNANLDLLRAAAISMVVVYHLIQNSPVWQPGLMQVVVFGQFGVDLFFVLSGWLIGRLYWKEHARFGSVAVLRFWARRWMRTIPPYLVALSLAWLAVFVERSQPFDFGYLAFIQNYYHTIPFFVVSWSLCIEEHFYLLIPLLLVWGARDKRYGFALFTLLIVIAPICRTLFVSTDGAITEFVYTHTATHLRMEGLLLGFIAACLPNHSNALMLSLQEKSRWLIGFFIVAFSVFIILPPLLRYRLGLTILPLGFMALLIWLVGRKPSGFASSRLIRWLAISSYSVYLTHTSIIQVALKLIRRVPAAPWQMYFPLALALIGIGGWGFYQAVERTSISLRDRWITRRQGVGITAGRLATPNGAFEASELSLVSQSTTSSREI